MREIYFVFRRLGNSLGDCNLGSTNLGRDETVLEHLEVAVTAYLDKFVVLVMICEQEIL